MLCKHELFIICTESGDKIGDWRNSKNWTLKKCHSKPLCFISTYLLLDSWFQCCSMYMSIISLHYWTYYSMYLNRSFVNCRTKILTHTDWTLVTTAWHCFKLKVEDTASKFEGYWQKCWKMQSWRANKERSPSFEVKLKKFITIKYYLIQNVCLGYIEDKMGWIWNTCDFINFSFFS